MPKISQPSKKTIGLDLDDTIRDHSVNRRRLNKKLGPAPNPTEVKKILYGELSLTCRPVKNSLKIIHRLLQQGHKIIIVSRNKPAGRTFARQWLAQYLPEISSRKIYFVDEDKGKASICSKERVNFFIDDKPTVLQHLNKSVIKILFDPQQEFPTTKFNKITQWTELEDLLSL